MRVVLRRLTQATAALALLAGAIGCLKESPAYRPGFYSILNMSRVEFLEALPSGRVYQLWAADIDTINSKPVINRRMALARFNWDQSIAQPVSAAGAEMSRVIDADSNMFNFTHLLLTIEPESGAPRPVDQAIVLATGVIDKMNYDCEMEPPINTSDANFLDIPPYFINENFYYVLSQSFDRWDFDAYPELGHAPDEFNCGGASPCPQIARSVNACGDTFETATFNFRIPNGPTWRDSAAAGYGIWFGEPSVSDKFVQDTIGYIYQFSERTSDYACTLMTSCAGSSWSNKITSKNIIRPKVPTDTLFEVGHEHDPAYIVGFRFSRDRLYTHARGADVDSVYWPDTCVIRVDRIDSCYCNHPIPFIDTLYRTETLIRVDTVEYAILDTIGMSVDTTYEFVDIPYVAFTKIKFKDLQPGYDPNRLVTDCINDTFWVVDVWDTVRVDTLRGIDTTYQVEESGDSATAYYEQIDSTFVTDTTVVTVGGEKLFCDLVVEDSTREVKNIDTTRTIRNIKQLIIDTTIVDEQLVIDTTIVTITDTTLSIDTTVTVVVDTTFSGKVRIEKSDVIFLEQRVVAVDTTYLTFATSDILAVRGFNPAFHDTAFYWTPTADSLQADSTTRNYQAVWQIDTLDFTLVVQDKNILDGDTTVTSTLETLPKLVSGWKYETWITFNDGRPPLSLGKWTDKEKRDDSNPYLGVDELGNSLDDHNFQVPGEDFLNNLPAEYGDKIDLVNDQGPWKIFITVEPEPDFAPDEPYMQMIMFSNYLPKTNTFYGTPNIGAEKQPLRLRDINTTAGSLNEGHRWPRIVVDLEDSGK